MLVLLIFSFMAGVVTVLSPCILPVLPIILAGAVGSGMRRPWGIVAGFVTSFTFFTLSLATLARWCGLSGDGLRMASIILLALFGLFLCVPALQLLFEKAAARVLPQSGTSSKGQGFWSGVLVGVSLGVVWTPCVGPIMAAVITLAAASAVNAAAVFITLAYAAGTSVPMLAIMFGGRRLLDRLPWIKAHAGAVQRVFGVVMILVALVLFKGYDRGFEAWILARFPSYGSGLTAIENNDRVSKILRGFTGGVPAGDAAEKMAPDLIAGGQWFNSPALSLKDLRGKVVLIDFWTYTCINCLRTLPVLKAWHERYARQGLVIIGVHTPEFAFEKNPDNVGKAVRDLGLKYPVVQDNTYATWNAYGNRYWPAKYFIDKAGKIRGTHFGEGGEEESETLIRQLLAEAGGRPGAFAEKHDYVISANTPETYLGLDRTERFESREELTKGAARYSLPAMLPLDAYGYQGAWNVADDHSSPEAGAEMDFHFSARNVYLVMRPGKKVPGRVEVFIDGRLAGAAEQGADVKDGYVAVKDDRLYHLLSLKESGEHTLSLKFVDGSIDVFAFTFG
ncbi:MAG: cytochrome c biogenesis protein DipZ [Candidatus Omnitrophica bacterium]|nr:cytochrome c biogenesis protein DipZ [Candidatus Omnitrophota bacterium]